MTRITDDLVRAARDMRAAGRSLQEIAGALHLAETTVAFLLGEKPAIR
jgi:orotate phosphoribosyltransferase-like protein